ncbi:hypothetical protein [Chromobacterium paludis]|uniref:Uncharacterized protein n=1 Tax=Chromobacterium paludis TaxID=2605945 RepID=A0A5C1DFI4_9NEIS|nr:hypothetical protein [Chromobacterium paludis]QEL55491.1 hypothetical protein FYK34_07895 [Chromobacterium paludis]
MPLQIDLVGPIQHAMEPVKMLAYVVLIATLAILVSGLLVSRVLLSNTNLSRSARRKIGQTVGSIVGMVVIYFGAQAVLR